jgi:hypothetical protein
MAMLRLLVILAPLAIVYALTLAGRRMARNRQRAQIAPQLRGEMEAHQCYTTTLTNVSIFGPGRFAGNYRHWVPLPAPRRLIVGTDAFIVSVPSAALGVGPELVFRGCECSIAYSRAPSRLGNRDCIVITGLARRGQVWLAISHDNLPEIWPALAATGAEVVEFRDHAR